MRGGSKWLVAASVVAGLGVGVLAVLTRMRRIRLAASAMLNESLPVNSAWWRARAKEKGELLYVALGDSAAQGIGASRPERGYVGILAERIAGRSGRTVRTVNLSVSGATVGQAVDYQLPRLAKRSPDIVTVSIGANDIATWDATAFERALTAVLDALPPHSIVADLPCFYLPRNERKVAEANDILRRLAAERDLSVAPLHALTAAPGLLGVLAMFAGDRFHPNDTGYRVWASAFAPLVDHRIDELLASRTAADPTGTTRSGDV